MNDDMHRYGALRESYAVEYSVLEQSDKNSNTHFNFDVYDTYRLVSPIWVRSQTSTPNFCTGPFRSGMRSWSIRTMMSSGSKEAWVNQLHSHAGAQFECRRLLGSGRSMGAMEDLPQLRAGRSATRTTSWLPALGFTANGNPPKATRSAPFPLPGITRLVEFREKFEAPFFRYYLHGTGEKFGWKASTFQTGSNTWHSYDTWPPRESKADKSLPAIERHALV